MSSTAAPSPSRDWKPGGAHAGLNPLPSCAPQPEPGSVFQTPVRTLVTLCLGPDSTCCCPPSGRGNVASLEGVLGTTGRITRPPHTGHGQGPVSETVNIK